MNYDKNNIFKKVFKKLLKCNKVTITLDVREFSSGNSYEYKMINLLVTNRIGTIANRWSLDYVLKLFYISKNIPSYGIRTSAYNKLKLMLRKFNVFSERIIFKMKYDESISFGFFKKILKAIVLNLPLSMSVKVNIAKNSRLIPLSHQKISDILCNHIKMAKAFRKGKVPVCVCMKTPHIIDNMEHFSSDVKSVFDLGANFVVKGVFDYKSEIWNAMHDMIVRYIVPLCGKRNLDIFYKNIDTITLLEVLGFDTNIINYIRCNVDNLVIKQDRTHLSIINMKSIYRVKEELQGFVVLPKDKNINQLMIL